MLYIAGQGPELLLECSGLPQVDVGSFLESPALRPLPPETPHHIINGAGGGPHAGRQTCCLVLRPVKASMLPPHFAKSVQRFRYDGRGSSSTGAAPNRSGISRRDNIAEGVTNPSNRARQHHRAREQLIGDGAGQGLSLIHI
mgnify:CR=1 FL=1